MDRAIEYRSNASISALSSLEGKCGKNDAPEESMQFNRGSRDFSPSGKKVIQYDAFEYGLLIWIGHVELQLDPCRRARVIRGLTAIPSNSHTLSVAQRGIHDINNQLLFKSNSQFIFHELSWASNRAPWAKSRRVKSFIAETCSKARSCLSSCMLFGVVVMAQRLNRNLLER